MKIVLIHGQNHKGSTYNVSRLLVEKLRLNTEDFFEFYVNDIPACIGCTNCIIKGEDKCLHRDFIEPIAKSIEDADIIIIDSPTYCLGMSGQLKIFFDHMAYRFLVHRPHKSMDSKIGIAISTTAAAGAGKTTKDIATQMFWWGIGKTYRLGQSVYAVSWDEVSENKKSKINKKINKLQKKVISKNGKVHRGLKGKLLFEFAKIVQKKFIYNPIDKEHWKNNGWI